MSHQFAEPRHRSVSRIACFKLASENCQRPAVGVLEIPHIPGLCVATRLYVCEEHHGVQLVFKRFYEGEDD